MAIEFEKHMKVFGNESQAGIISQIITFGSLNLKTLSKMINKAESTTLGHVKKLVDLNYIELDKNESEYRTGKFYKITDKTLEALNSIDHVDDVLAESEGDVKKKIFLNIARLFRALASWPRNLAYYAGVYMEDHADEILNSTDPVKTNDKMYFMNPKLSIKTKEEWDEFHGIMQDFHDKIIKFHDEKAEVTQFLSLISVPISDIHPIKEKRHNSIQ